MELGHGTSKASEFAPEDVISNMPENVISNIMDRLPIQDAVKTGILSKNWRFKWTLLTKLVFDDKLFDFLIGPNGIYHYDGSDLSRVFLHLKDSITKFVLYIPDNEMLKIDDINHWVLFLTRKGIKELTIINMREIPLKLPTQLFFCLELKYLKLRNCYFRPFPNFRDFPKLMTLNLNLATLGTGEFITRCPLLKVLEVSCDEPIGDVKLVEIAKLTNLKVLSLSLCVLYNMSMITSSSIFELMGLLPKLENLYLDFRKCKLLAEVGAEKRALTSFPCLKTLTLHQIDFSSDIMVSFAFEMICGSVNLQILNIIAAYKNVVPPPAICFSEVDYSTMRQLQQLRGVGLTFIRDSENEVCLIKYLLACSPLLKGMLICPSVSLRGDRGGLLFARKLLRLPRASPLAEIDFYSLVN